MWEKLSTKLISIITANTKLTAVYPAEVSDLSGSPVATLTPSSNDADYDTTTENRRVYAFNLRLYAIRKSGNAEELITESAMRELVDTILNNLDSQHRLTGLDTQAGYTYLLMEAVPTRWGYTGRENGYRVAELTIRVHFHIDVNVVS